MKNRSFLTETFIDTENLYLYHGICMKTFSLRWKITIPAAILLVISIVLLTGRVSSVFSASYREVAIDYVESQGFDYALEIQNTITSYEHIVNGVTSSFKSVLNCGVRNRNILNRMLSYYLTTFPQNKQINGLKALWVMMEPDSLGNDAEFAYTQGDEYGRYTPMFYIENPETPEYTSFEREKNEDYYSLPKNSKKVTFLEPYLYDDYLTTSICAPITDGKNNVIGVCGVDINADFIGATFNDADLLDGTSITVTTAEGTIIYSHATETIGQNVNLLWQKTNPSGIENIKTAMNQDSPVQKQININGEKILNICVPVEIGFYQPAKWCLCINVPTKSLNKPVVRCINQTIILGVICLAALMMFLFVILNKFSIVPVIQLAKISETLAQGDYTYEFPNESLQKNDEIGQTTRAFKSMIDETKGMLSGIKEINRKLSTSGGQLSQSASDTKAQTQALASNLSKVVSVTNEQSNQVEMTSQELKSILDNIRKFEETIEAQIDSVDQSSSATQEMVATIASVNSTVNTLSTQYKQLMTASHSGLEKQEEVESAITKIVELAENLTATNTIIEEIANQTNMLAMNAAIEAAHAGDSGKGFAVVAEEIRKLAEDSTEQTAQIKEQVQQMDSGVASIVQANLASKSSFDDIVSLISNIESLLSQVNMSVTEESAASKEVLNGLSRISEMNQEINSATQSISSSSSSIAKTVEKLKDISTVVNTSITEMGKEIETIEGAALTVADITDETTNHIDMMNKKMSRFKIEA